MKKRRSAALERTLTSRDVQLMPVIAVLFAGMGVAASFWIALGFLTVAAVIQANRVPTGKCG